MGSKQEEKPSTSTAATPGALGAVGASSSKTWKCEGELVSSKITPTLVESYTLKWETTLKQTPGEKYIRSKSYLINAGNENESNWRIELDPNFTDANGTRYLSAYLLLEKTFKPDAVIPAFYQFGVHSVGETLGHGYRKYGGLSKFSAEKPSFGLPKYISIAQLGKLGDPNSTEKLSFVVTLQILKEDLNRFPVEQEAVDVDIEEVDEAQSAVFPFNPEEKPTRDSFLRLENVLIPVDTTRVNYFTDYLIPYYISKEKTITELENAVDMAQLFGSKKKFEKLMEFCHTGQTEFPKKFEGLIGFLDMAVMLEIEQLKQLCGLEVLARLDITNFVQVVELAVGKTLDLSVANPTIWKFMIENLHALNQDLKFKETYPKYKPYYEALFIQDDPRMDDDGQGNQDDDGDMDFYN